MNLRAFMASDGTYMPPDLASSELAFDIKKENQHEQWVTLDFDHFTTNKEFEAKAVDDTMENLHRVIDQAFKATVTQDAIEFWRDEN